MDLPLSSMRNLLRVRSMLILRRNRFSPVSPVSRHQVSPSVGMVTCIGVLTDISRLLPDPEQQSCSATVSLSFFPFICFLIKQISNAYAAAISAAAALRLQPLE